MNRSLLISLLLFPLTAMSQTLLPLPQHFTKTNGSFDVSSFYKFENTVGDEAKNLYLDNFFRNNGGSTKVFMIRKAVLKNSSNEAYRLHISKDSVVVEANSQEGFLRAGQTLMQLKQKNSLQTCDVEDAPELSWRGFMLDLSRHFYPLSFLKKQVDLMASFKMNKFHLHLTDGAGWRLQIKRYPRLTKIAGWRTQSDWVKWWRNHDRRYVTEGTDSAYGGYYTQEEMRELVAYAQERGIEIIPEIEMPGHSEEVLTTYPEIDCRNAYDSNDSSLPMTGSMCPGNEGTYSFLENVLTEVLDIFPSKYVHIGGDEADMKAWKTCPLCQQKMKEEGFKKENQLQAYLIRRIASWLKAHNKQLLGWDEIIADSLGSNASVMVWRTQEYTADALKKGYDVVLAPNSHCYINRQQDAPELGSAGGYLSIEKIYSFKPLQIEGVNAQTRKNVLGVQACLWTEFVNEATDAEYMMWPRLLAMSEIGWRGEAPESFSNFRKRALVFADAIRKQKVNAFDLRKEKGERKESLKPVKHLAIGAKVTYNHHYSNAYAASKEATLVDGQLGGWNHSDRLWQGFIGKQCLDFVVDLGKETPIQSISMGFMQNAGPDIYYPGTLTISLSTDGSNYEQVYRHEQPELNDGLQFQTWQWKGKKTARYIHVVGTQPRSNMWIFTDEIIVK